ncbi:hypothetical protein VNO77_02576 [Canavalia gladiata]|uniref:Uncharacterized protein n=1 Tax=Canavalia gladiata TaxID=3824 RepID=A0AAN9MTA1_CANGL
MPVPDEAREEDPSLQNLESTFRVPPYLILLMTLGLRVKAIKPSFQDWPESFDPFEATLQGNDGSYHMLSSWVFTLFDLHDPSLGFCLMVTWGFLLANLWKGSHMYLPSYCVACSPAENLSYGIGSREIGLKRALWQGYILALNLIPWIKSQGQFRISKPGWGGADDRLVIHVLSSRAQGKCLCSSSRPLLWAPFFLCSPNQNPVF